MKTKGLKPHVVNILAYVIIMIVITMLNAANPMYTLKLTTVGSSTGVVIPVEMLKSMKLEKGDSLYAVETPEGYVLSPYNPEVESQIKQGRAFIKQNREVFKALAE
jgi:putative addiction module antidote